MLGKDGSGTKAIRFAMSDPTLRIRADERMLRQILINLVTNSLKFAGENGVIDVRVERTADGVDIVVRDNGIGIPDDKLELVMQPFGQADDAFIRSRGGIGLGLPIVKSLAEMHGGRFSLDSEEHKGTVARA